MKYICPHCELGVNISIAHDCKHCGEFILPIIIKDPPKEKKAYQGLKKTRLKPVSNKQRNLISSYKSSVPMNQGGCARCKSLDNLEKHHPYGRSSTVDGKPSITLWIWLCHFCHRWVHDNGNQAYAEGWLQPEYRNQIGTAPKPWETK